jgi:restriction system protein
MPVPKVQSMLLPILRHIGEGRSVETIRERLKEQFQITPAEAEMTHAKSSQNVYVNRVAWALAHLMMGGLIRKAGITDGNY